MSRQLKSDLRTRFIEAERACSCVIPSSANEARRLRYATKSGKLFEVFQNVFARPEYWATLKQKQRALHILRTEHAAHPTWVFCGPSAALIYGLSVSYHLLSEVHILTSRQSHSRSSNGICRHISTGQVTAVVREMPVTTLMQTVYDCLRTTDFKNGMAIADSALHLGLSSKEELLRFFEQQDKRNKGHSQAISTILHSDARAESGGESIARATIIEQGFELPDLQHVVQDPVDESLEYRVDFWWELEDQSVIIGELDGHDKYIDPEMTMGKSIVEVMADERLRESRVCGTGARVMRFSYADVLNTSYFVHLLESFGVPRTQASIESTTVRMSTQEACLLEVMRNEALRCWNLYRDAQANGGFQEMSAHKERVA